jgi:hypothetical protein
MSSPRSSEAGGNDILYQAQVKAAQYNTPFVKSSPAKSPSKELVSHYRQLNSIRMLHRKLMDTGKEVRALEEQVSTNLTNTMGHKFRTTLRQFNILESNFETTTPSEDMRDSIYILNLIIAEQREYKHSLEEFIQENKETKNHRKLASSRKGRIRSVIRVTDHRRKSRVAEKGKKPVVFAPWLQNIVNQKIAETSKISGVRKRL